MMKEDYSNHKAEDLLQDEYFFEWLIYPESDREGCWESALEEDTNLSQEIRFAQGAMSSIATEKDEMSLDEMRDVWTNITNVAYGCKRDHSRRRIGVLVSIAATVAILVIGGLALLQFRGIGHENLAFEKIIGTPITEQSGDIQLILSDKKQMSIAGKDVELLYDPDGKLTVNSHLIDVATKPAGESKSENKFNQLIVPKGRRSSVILADGSKIWLNAGSRLVYPEKFEVAKREIYIEGEAFLEVNRDEQRPFFVRTKKMNLKVLGTSFNVSAYGDESFSSVTLVTGKVQVVCGKKEVTLCPNDQVVYGDDQMHVSQVHDVYEYIAWKDGVYYFRSERLKDVLHKLGKYYRINIECNPSIASESCSGKIDLKENIQEVLNGLQNIITFKYEIDGNTLKIGY